VISTLQTARPAPTPRARRGEIRPRAKYLMEIALDNGGRLERTSYVFEYAGVQFKLLQEHPRKHADHLLTILPTGSVAERQKAYAAASNFSAALSWANRTATAVWEVGGRGWHGSWRLRGAQSRMRTFPRIPFNGLVVGCSLNALPTIQNNEQKLALTLFREARASNNEYLSFLFFWQVLAIAGNPEGVAEKLHRRQRAKLRFSASDVAALPTGARSLGNYLADDCRNAIAHVRSQKSGSKRLLEFDSIEDRTRMARSVRVVQELARVCIEETLRLTKQSLLVRVPGSTVPRYVDEEEIRSGLVRHSPAYPRLYRGLVFPSPRGGRGKRRTVATDLIRFFGPDHSGKWLCPGSSMFAVLRTRSE
jgi:hypothetical protein